MAYIDYKRYVWLIDLVNNFDGVTFDDIDEAWQDEPELNPGVYSYISTPA